VIPKQLPRPRSWENAAISEFVTSWTLKKGARLRKCRKSLPGMNVQPRRAFLGIGAGLEMVCQSGSYGKCACKSLPQQKLGELRSRSGSQLKRESDLLKQEIEALKKYGAKASTGQAEGSLFVTVNDVEYVYQGSTRNGAEMLVMLLAASKNGEKPAPRGEMFLVDPEGSNYQGMPIGGFGAPQTLRESVPLKLTWRFGPNPLTRQDWAPWVKITRFASLSVASGPAGPIVVEFRDLLAMLS